MLFVGIDLGTTNSLISLVKDDKPIILAQSESIVSLIPGGAKVGEEARESKFPLRSTKRLIGRCMSSLSEEEVKEYGLISAKGDDEKNDIKLPTDREDISVTPIEVASEILFALKKSAEASSGLKIEKAVLTVPAYFDDNRRNATRLAAKIAGIDVIRLINEPTAAAVAYGMDGNIEGKVVVYDLGGGTFDVSVLEMQKGVLRVIATGGDSAIGGDDLDKSLQVFLKDELGLEYTSLECRKIKEALSFSQEYKLKTGIVNRGDAEKVWEQIVNKTISIMRKTIYDSGDENDIERVIFVGGASRVPMIRKKVKEVFGIEPYCEIDPDKVVAYGAAIHAKNLQFPSNELLLDVIPLSLGIEVKGGLVEKVILRNSSIPAVSSKVFGVQHEEQRFIVLHVVQGESDKVAGCRSLAKFKIPCKPNSKVKVTFCVDSNGILSVSAEDETTDEVVDIVCSPSYGLDLGQIRDLIGG